MIRVKQSRKWWRLMPWFPNLRQVFFRLLPKKPIWREGASDRLPHQAKDRREKGENFFQEFNTRKRVCLRSTKFETYQLFSSILEGVVANGRASLSFAYGTINNNNELAHHRVNHFCFFASQEWIPVPRVFSTAGFSMGSRFQNAPPHAPWSLNLGKLQWHQGISWNFPTFFRSFEQNLFFFFLTSIPLHNLTAQKKSLNSMQAN